MKRCLYFILALLLLSEPIYSQTTAKYAPWYTQSNFMYRNLEKYWWYRYRLVNDFMKIGTECGESIPMEKWEFKSPKNKVYWGDATQHLGNYINALAGEWRILRDCKLYKRRTEEELYYALKAFERLDKKAEPSWRNYDQTYPYCGNNDLPTGVEHSDDINGFFIRDDVPSIQTRKSGLLGGLNDFMEENRQHFHRPGFFYITDTVSMEDGYGADANFPGHPSKRGAGWAYARGPGEESQDQIVMLYAGMSMTGWLLGGAATYNGWNLGDKAKEQLYRIFEWPAFNGCHTFAHWTVCNPFTNKCVGDPRRSCNDGGGIISFNSVGAVEGLNHLGLLPAAAGGPHSYSNLLNTTNRPFWQPAFQLTQALWPTTFGRGSELIYSNTYAAVANDWAAQVRVRLGPLSFSIRVVNTTKDLIALHSTKSNWTWPHLPLIWQIINGQGPGSTVWFNAAEKRFGNSPVYTDLLNYAPFCGCHSYETGTPSFRSGNPNRDYGMNEDYKGQNAWQWSNANRLQDYGKRGDDDNSDFNNLDYMVVFNLYAIVDGKKAIDKMMNPYYRENYEFDFPLSNGYGTKTNALKLNFLEYLSMVNKINPTANVGVRGAKKVDFYPGFEAKYGCVFDAYVRDYRCQEEGYVYALAKGTPVGYNPGFRKTSASDSTSYNDDTAYHPLDFPPDGVPFNIEIDSEQYYRNMPTDDTVSEEDLNYYRDSLINVIYASGDSDLIKAIQPLIQSQPQPGARIARPLSPGDVRIYPNPGNGTFTVQTGSEAPYDLLVLSSLGAIVYEEKRITSPNKTIHLDNSLSPGIYTIQLTGADIRHIQKIFLIR